ncbi:cell division protein FtsA [Patescibacteria group bacterium]|nr:cell division protein FtsA [Patescibacteria group bacterium]MBU4162335.1 cell division protein FtsA [Patescibacteria group bacterium]
MARTHNIVSALDIGSGYVKGMVAQRKRDGEDIAVLSVASVLSDGMKRGVVIDADVVSDKINHVLTKLNNEISPHRIREVFINIGGAHIISEQGHGAVAISRADQRVSPDDVDRVKEEAKTDILSRLTSNQEILDIFPKEFIVDSEVGSEDVVGMKGIKLEVNALAICAFSPYLNKVVETVMAAGVEKIAEVIPSPLASAKALLTPQQKELGAVLVDIGAETTGIAVFEDRNLIHLAILPVGSAHITRDIAIALQADINIAEEIKSKFGSYIFQNKTKKEKISINKDEDFVFDTKKMVKAGRARLTEIFNLVDKELKKIGKQEALPAGVILAGGGSKLPGIINFVKGELKLPIRKGAIKNFLGLEDDLGYSVLCGLVLNGLKEEGGRTPNELLFKAKKFFKIFIP